MGSVKPIYIVLLLVVIALAVFIKVNNPYREYSTSQYWESATIESVNQVPDEALALGNKNGPVLMWAAMGSTDPNTIKALVERGADINESDGIFKGTPLTGAAGYSKNPEIIRELVKLGADISKKVHNNETALMVAAQYNHNPGIIEVLVSLGADTNDVNLQGKTALDLAKSSQNTTAQQSLRSL